MKHIVLAAALVAGGATSAPAPAPVTGLWLTPGGQALVRIETCGAQLCGRIAKVLKPRAGGPAIDSANHDPALRARPMEGLAILTGFVASGGGWAGQIYDPSSGRSYRSQMARRGDTLEVKGCLGPFCRTQEWTAQR